MLSNFYSVDVLVNNKPVRQYPHKGRVFVEARKNQEYNIRVKNNGIGRVLCVTAIDGINILSGVTAKEDDTNGYVINGYNSIELDGFRVSNEKVARFVFNEKSKSYAATKNDGSESEVGVIGIRLYDELIKTTFTTTWDGFNSTPFPFTTNPIYGPMYGNSAYPKNTGDPIMDFGSSTNVVNSCFYSSNASSDETLSMRLCDTSPKGFDTGTEFGAEKNSKVTEVPFEVGTLSSIFKIYYASKESLIEMGVKIDNEREIRFPEPFKPSKYAVPPKNWTGTI